MQPSFWKRLIGVLFVAGSFLMLLRSGGLWRVGAFALVGLVGLAIAVQLWRGAIEPGAFWGHKWSSLLFATAMLVFAASLGVGLTGGQAVRFGAPLVLVGLLVGGVERWRWLRTRPGGSQVPNPVVEQRDRSRRDDEQ